MSKIRNAAAYLSNRLGERSTKLGIALALGLAGKQIAPELLDSYIEIVTTGLSFLLMLLPDTSSAKPIDSKTE